MSNPFGSTFESFGTPRGPLVETVHQDQFQKLTDLLDSGEGQLISLRAPRAGYGKTMLLSRLRQSRQASALFIPVHLADGRRVEGEFILEEILTQMADVLPAGGGLTRLDLHTRRLFAQGLMPMVYSGEVPCQDREGALASLRDRPTEAFDFHHEGAAIAQWSREQFALLGPRLSAVLSKASGASGRDVGYWTDLFFNYAIRPPSDVARTGDLMDAVFGDRSRFHSGAGFLEGLGSFLNLITLVEPVILILDEVEGLSSDSDAALRAASCLTSLWEAAPRVSVILSVNDDVWDSAFAPRLPLGLRDRLEDVVVRLDALTDEQARALVTIRAGDEASKVLERIDLDGDALYPRGILRQAREAWDHRDEPLPALEGEAENTAPESKEVEVAVSAVPMVQYHREEVEAVKPEESVPVEPPISPAAPVVDEKKEVVPASANTESLPPEIDAPRQLEGRPSVDDFAGPPAEISQPVSTPFAVASAPVESLEVSPAPAPAQPISPFTKVTLAEPQAPPMQSFSQAPPAQPISSPFSVQVASEPAQALPSVQQVEEPQPPVQKSPFAVAPQPPVTIPVVASAAPQPFVQPSPFVQPPQPETVPPQFAPQAPVDSAPRLAENADAIDDLLRQFRSRNDG